MGGAQISLPEISIRAPIQNRYSPDYILSCSRIMDNHAVKYALSGGMKAPISLDNMEMHR